MKATTTLDDLTDKMLDRILIARYGLTPSPNLTRKWKLSYIRNMMRREKREYIVGREGKVSVHIYARRPNPRQRKIDYLTLEKRYRRLLQGQSRRKLGFGKKMVRGSKRQVYSPFYSKERTKTGTIRGRKRKE